MEKEVKIDFLRRKINNAVGVELFEPYVQEAKEQKVHDKYLLMMVDLSILSTMN